MGTPPRRLWPSHNFLVIGTSDRLLNTVLECCRSHQGTCVSQQPSLLIQHLRSSPRPLAASTQMGLENLTYVHPRRNTQRVQNDINRFAVLVIRHIFDRHHHRDNTLVTVTARHLVARLDTTLDRKVNLNDLQYAGRKIITLLQLAFLIFKALFKFFLRSSSCAARLSAAHSALVCIRSLNQL